MSSSFSCTEVDLVWKYADWLMERDELMGVKVRLYYLIRYECCLYCLTP